MLNVECGYGELISLLRSLVGQTVLYRPNQGNAGDSAINCVAYDLFALLGCSYELIAGDVNVERTRGRVVVYGGGGSFIPLYGGEQYYGASHFVRKHHQSWQHLIVLPHTIRGYVDLL